MLRQSKTKGNALGAKFKEIIDDNVSIFNQSELETETSIVALNERISNLVISAGGDNPNQVVDACVDARGIRHKTLKDRLDADYRYNQNEIKDMGVIVDNFSKKLNVFETKLNDIYSRNNRSITLNVSISGNDEKGDGSEAKPFKTIQKAVDSIPLINTSSYFIELDKGQYVEDVVVSGIKNGAVEIRSKAYKLLPEYPADTGVYVQSISFDACDGYVAVRGITQFRTGNTPFTVRFSRCDYAVVSSCAFTNSTRGKDFKAIIYNSANGHVYSNTLSNQHIVLSAEYNSLVTFAYLNEGLNNEKVISSSRSITFNNNSSVKGEQFKEFGGQIF